MAQTTQKVVLMVLDGWGVAQPSVGNAITAKPLEHFENIARHYPIYTLQAAGEAVGLPWGEQGNSEVGHLSLGAGRIIYQNLPRITKAISDGEFVENQTFIKAINHAQGNQSALHIIGMVSDGGVHSYEEHLYALLEMCKMKDLKEVYIHAFLDGRDTPKDSAVKYIKKLQKVITKLGIGHIVSMSGRFYAMDRDNHWDRVEKAYNAMVLGQSDITASDPIQVLEASYESGVFDEEFIPTVITSEETPFRGIQKNDAVVMFNFRPDRARQITKALTVLEFDGFKRDYLEGMFMVTMTEYEKGLPVEVAFPPLMIGNPLAKVLSENNIKQLHIAETEKYAHVTYFFNGGREEPWDNEEHVLVPSPRVESYADKPEMAAREITKKVLDALASQYYEFILINFANADMVGHTGNLNATLDAVQVVDECVGQIIELTLNQNGVVLITADHGNAEELIKLKSGKIDKEHSSNPVPLMMIGEQWKGQATVSEYKELYLNTPVGVLADVAPTILKLFNIEKPEQMSGQSLV
ncbi:MAG: 2,3-bisphosphoglycerate-independent phosphoglycerate mutase [Patescibacteria group bacterium]